MSCGVSAMDERIVGHTGCVTRMAVRSDNQGVSYAVDDLSLILAARSACRVTLGYAKERGEERQERRNKGG